MNRPDDVSQEDWDAAGNAVTFRMDDVPSGMHVFTAISFAIRTNTARAIMAARLQEREECAKGLEHVASTYLPGGPMDAKAGLLLGAQAIRARK